MKVFRWYRSYWLSVEVTKPFTFRFYLGKLSKWSAGITLLFANSLAA